ncbi:ankyrin 3 [Fusarium sp. NRRL 52700]|nr:ankyrin 3 [Fusarium sp. NRRL 52700]
MSSHQSLPHGEAQLPVFFACIFYNTDPVQFHDCSVFRLGRLSDVSQHIGRRHLLTEVRLCTAQGAEAASKNGNEKGTCTDPKDIRVYDPICRRVFTGPSAETDLERHLADNSCQPKTIEETGMLLPKEYERLLSERDRATASPEAKWYAMWNVCFPPLTTTRFQNVPPSPYVQTIIAREAGETRIHQALGKLAISKEDHRSAFDEIVSGLYPVQSLAGAEVKDTVKDQQKERTRVLKELLSVNEVLLAACSNLEYPPQDAGIEEFCRPNFGSSEAAPPDFPSIALVHHHQQQQILEQANNGMMASSLVPEHPQQSQWPYPTMLSQYPQPRSQALPQMPSAAYEQYMELDDDCPSKWYTGGFSGTC